MRVGTIGLIAKGGRELEKYTSFGQVTSEVDLKEIKEFLVGKEFKDLDVEEKDKLLESMAKMMGLIK